MESKLDVSGSGSSLKEEPATTINGLANGPENKELEKLLECPNCQNIPLPPIYTCITGHIVCSPCKIVLERCRVCDEPFTASRNYPLESIVQNSTFNCNHRSQGCEAQLTAQDFTEHHAICPHRPMKCYLGAFDDCKESLLYISEYVEHLKEIHELPVYKCSDWSKNVFKINCTDSSWNDAATRSWPGCLLNYNGETFSTQVFKVGTVFYVGLVIVAEKIDAAKYAVSVTIQKTEGSVPKYELTTSVPSIRELEEERLIEDMPYAALDKDLLEKLGQFLPGDDLASETKFTWVIRYEIKTLMNGGCNVM